MRKTAHLPPSWWLSESHRKLAARGQGHLVAWIAIATGPMSHVSGVSYLPGGEVGNLIGIGADAAQAILRDLEQDGLMVWDAAHSIVWQPGVIELQLGSARWLDNPKWLAATISYLETLPVSQAIERFLVHYGIADRISDRYPIDTLSIPYRGGIRDTFPSCPIPSPPLPSGLAYPARKMELSAQDENGLDLPGGGS